MRILQINESVGDGSEKIISISTNEGTVKFIYLVATFPDSTPARAEYHIILDDIETDITDYIQNPAKSEISLEYSSTAKLKIINPNGSDISVRGYVVFEETPQKPSVYLVDGTFKNGIDFTGLYVSTSPPDLNSGQFKEITYRDPEKITKTLNPGETKGFIFLIVHPYVEVKALNGQMNISVRIDYPNSQYFRKTSVYTSGLRLLTPSVVYFEVENLNTKASNDIKFNFQYKKLNYISEIQSPNFSHVVLNGDEVKFTEV